MKNIEAVIQSGCECGYELKVVLRSEKSETVFSEGDS